MTPFPARRHKIGDALLLRPLGHGEVAILSRAIAAMEPFRGLGFSQIGLSLYLDRRDPALYRYVIEAEGECAGLIALRWPWLRGPFIEILAVLPEKRRGGLGSATVDWAAAKAAKLGANLWATTTDVNTTGRAFWKAQGFAEMAPLPGLVAADGAEILLRRRPTG